MSQTREKQLRNIRTCPPEGTGVHKWTICAAWDCRKAGLSKDETLWELLQRTSRSDSNEADREVRDAISAVWDSEMERRRKNAELPKFDAGARKRLVDLSVTEPSLRQLSPSPIPETAQEALRMLFPGDPLLCIGKSERVFDTKRASEWGDVVNRCQFVTPNTMSARVGKTKTGKPSARTESNTGPRRFIAVECDPIKYEHLPESQQAMYSTLEKYYRAERDKQAATLIHLNRYYPLACVTFSGNKSLHGLFNIEGEPEKDVVKFFRFASLLGADQAMLRKSQFARIPGGLRKNGVRQEILYFDESKASRGGIA